MTQTLVYRLHKTIGKFNILSERMNYTLLGKCITQNCRQKNIETDNAFTATQVLE